VYIVFVLLLEVLSFLNIVLLHFGHTIPVIFGLFHMTCYHCITRLLILSWF